MSNPVTINHLPSRTITHEGQEYLFFSGTAYLGLQQHPAFQRLVADGLTRYGTAFGSSRNGNLRLGVYDEAERHLATTVGAEAALTQTSGMMAGQMVVNYLRAQHATFVHGPHTHPALWDNPAVTLPDQSFADWTVQLPTQLQTLPPNPPGPVVICTNSLDAVRSEYYSFDWVNDLPDDRAIVLVVDDSHGLGVLSDGPRGYGRGIWPQLPDRPNLTRIVTASLAKAMGLPGGVVFGNAETVAGLRQTAFFGASSPVPPAYVDALLRADALYADGRNRLRENVKLAESLLERTGLFRHAKGYPVFYTEQDDLYAFLIERGILIYSFAYPTAADRANTRIVISAFHTFDDIQTLAHAVYAYIF